MDINSLPQYRWPDLSAVERKYLVIDDQGRLGIGFIDPVHHDASVMFVRPAGTPATIGNNGTYALPGNAILITSTAFHLRDDGNYYGTWYDYNGLGQTPAKDIRVLTILDDLGWHIPDKWADKALAESDKMGHWDFGATLGKVQEAAATLRAIPSGKRSQTSRDNGKKGGRPRKDSNGQAV